MHHLNYAGLLACGSALVVAAFGRMSWRWGGIVLLTALLCSILLWAISVTEPLRCIALNDSPPCTVSFAERWRLVDLPWAFLNYSALVTVAGVTGVLIRKARVRLKRRDRR